MTLAIMQPYLFPYIGYFQLLNAVDKFVIYDDVAFINRGWINRNSILNNGKAQLFTVPLKEASQNKLIHEISIDTDQKWRDKLLKTIQQNYKKAPHFAAVFPIVEAVFQQSESNISTYIYNSLTMIGEYLSIATPLVKSSTIYNNQHLKAQERILDICLQEKADHYINPIGGRELYNKDLFAEHGIQLNFIRSERVEYPQLGGEFTPWLSIIDVMMFNSKEQIQELLKAYILE
ncbi:hypothetical protein BWI96_01830 [Siphonobacter sp. SORGH_AS_0500]|uniref:WbqC family protein n=1 Tax=Siphonobacter sp. SORGH_AS_0500 TaxID=1864824 RepID=UPI000CAF6933|nr:WbqC family protein [Siphonobacter sp. SORGH_AS_0500]PKK38534.1 hypothetical protein BWI96_01830 [Siphonobacter sp. SORGH_AS_0500]